PAAFAQPTGGARGALLQRQAPEAARPGAAAALPRRYSDRIRDRDGRAARDAGRPRGAGAAECGLATRRHGGVADGRGRKRASTGGPGQSDFAPTSTATPGGSDASGSAPLSLDR